MDKKVIAIIAAMDEEVNEIKKIMNDQTCIEKRGIKIIIGNIEQNECLLVKCDVGKVNSARITQFIIDNYNIKYIINVGSSGAINSELNIGDIVIADKVVQYDFDISVFNHKKGYIPNVGNFVKLDNYLIEKSNDILKIIIENDELENVKIKIGTIATGDTFCTDIQQKRYIYNEFNADAVEMEGGAIAQVSYLSNIPCLIIRSISDTPNGSNSITFDQFLKLASRRCADFLYKLISYNK